MQRVVTRDLTGEDPAGEIDTWWTSQVTFTTVRPQESTPVPSTPGRSAALADGVRLLDHPSFRANARLSTASVSSRDLGTIVLPRLLRDDPTVSLPFPLVATRSCEPSLSTLELTDIEGDSYKAVTPGQPLRLLVPRTLEAEESVLPVAYDGEFFLPLGHAAPAAAGTTELILERLPEPTTAGKKSLRGSIRIFFQKVVGRESASPPSTRSSRQRRDSTRTTRSSTPRTRGRSASLSPERAISSSTSTGSSATRWRWRPAHCGADSTSATT